MARVCGFTPVHTSLDNIIRKNKIVVITMNNCPFCAVAKNIIEKHTTAYKNEAYKPAYYDWLIAKTGRSSLPAVFINGIYVGGCNDGGLGGVTSLDNQGILEQLIK